MIDLLLCILFTGLLCNGVYISTSKGMLLYFIRRGLDIFFYIDTVPVEDKDNPGQFKELDRYRKVYYPILHCIKCMPSTYGSCIALWFLPFTLELTWQIPLIVLCSVPVSTIMYLHYD